MSSRIALALSGGVDSSVAALLLKQRGWQVHTFFFRFWARHHQLDTYIQEQEKRAQTIARQLELPFTSLDFSQDQEQTVVNHFLTNYRQGLVPNPCSLCNKQLKFAKFFNFAKEQGFQAIATGHYARIVQNQGHFYIQTAQDSKKDQSYFLYQLDEALLQNIIWPLGDLCKDEVRQIATQAQLISAQSQDSSDICFLHGTTARQFLLENLKQRTGRVIDQSACVIGEHQGVHLYTIGQRQGFQINHRLLAHGSLNYAKAEIPALFVVNKDIQNNLLIVGPKSACYQDHLQLQQLRLSPLAQVELDRQQSLKIHLKIRNTDTLHAATLREAGLVQLREPLFAINPGQAAVFYQQDLVIGGGIIAATHEKG